MFKCEVAPDVSVGFSMFLSASSSEYGVHTCGSRCLHIQPASCLVPQVTQHIATCQPLSVALDNGHVILCDMMADPWVSVPSPSWIQKPMEGDRRRA